MKLSTCKRTSCFFETRTNVDCLMVVGFGLNPFCLPREGFLLSFVVVLVNISCTVVSLPWLFPITSGILYNCS